MFSDPLLAAVNIVLVIGIALAVVASVKLKKMNQELHAENRARKKRNRLAN